RISTRNWRLSTPTGAPLPAVSISARRSRPAAKNARRNIWGRNGSQMTELFCLGTFFLLCFGLIACVYLGRTAIFVYTVGCILVSNVTVLKQVEFFGLTTSLAVFIFSATYLASDIVTEYWGRREA